MEIAIPEGISLSRSFLVQPAHLDTARKGKIGILTTLSVLEIMEETCEALSEGYLPENHTLISVEMNVKHIEPIVVGKNLVCIATLKYVDEENLYFDVALLDEEQNEVALGAQEYTIVEIQKFKSSL